MSQQPLKERGVFGEWRLEIEGDTLAVAGPQGAYVAHEHDRDNIASVILFRFARDVLRAKYPISEGAPKWRNADHDPPADEQTVLACWKGSSCIEGMETLTYHAADAPDGPECWQDVHGEDRDPPTHWTVLEFPHED